MYIICIATGNTNKILFLEIYCSQYINSLNVFGELSNCRGKVDSPSLDYKCGFTESIRPKLGGHQEYLVLCIKVSHRTHFHWIGTVNSLNITN